MTFVATTVLACTIAFAQEEADGTSFLPEQPARVFIETKDPLLRERARRILMGRGEENREDLLGATKAEDPRLREATIFALRNLGGEDVDRALALALRDDDVAVRVAALRTLAFRGQDPPFDPEVLRASQSEHWSLRRASALALARMQDPQALKRLHELAFDPDPDVSRAAKYGLIISPATTPDALISIFDPEDSDLALAVLDRLALFKGEPVDSFLRETLFSDAAASCHIMTAEALSRRWQNMEGTPGLEELLDGMANSDPTRRDLALLGVMRGGSSARKALLNRLSGSGGQEVPKAAEALVELEGPNSLEALLGLITDESASNTSRFAAVHVLRRFRTAETAEELVWAYSPDLPLEMRNELSTAFESLPSSDGTRSGLISVLEDPDSNLRLRAFWLITRAGARTPEDIEFLTAHVAAEKDDTVRGRMKRVIANHSTGEGASLFARQMVAELESGNATVRSAAIDALENLQDRKLRHQIGKTVAAQYPNTDDPVIIRLLTRLRSEEADRVVGEALARAAASGRTDDARKILIALRTGGGDGTLGVVRQLLEQGPEELHRDARRTLLTRGDPSGFHSLDRVYDDLPFEERAEAISVLTTREHPDGEALFQSLLERERDDIVRGMLADRAAELRVPVESHLVPLLQQRQNLPLLIQAAECLASLRSEVAANALREEFMVVMESVSGNGFETAEQQLLFESLARAAASTGQLDLAPHLASALFWEAEKRESLLYESEASFPFESTVLRALTDLGAASGMPADVAAAVEVEVDSAADSGLLFLLPKALFLDLAKVLKNADEAFLPLRASFLELALRLPPFETRHELQALTGLAELSRLEGDHARCAALLDRARLLVDRGLMQETRTLREALGKTVTAAGFHPKRNLRARALLARARERLRFGEMKEARELIEAGVHEARDDAWLRLAVVADLLAYECDSTWLGEHARATAQLGRNDGELLLHLARILAEGGYGEDFDRVRASRDRLVACGLEASTVRTHLAIAEALVLLERMEEAGHEVMKAIRLDDSARERIRINPLLSVLLQAPKKDGPP